MDERNRFVRGSLAWVGFKSIGVRATPAAVRRGLEGHTFPVIDLAFKGIFAHSLCSAEADHRDGLLHQVGAFVLAVIILTIRWFTRRRAVRRVSEPSSRFLLLAFGGLAFMMGILSEYVGLIYEEVKQRPNYVVRDRLGI